MMPLKVQSALETAINKRKDQIVEPYQTAFRLINGFLEGIPKLVIEVFAKTIVFHDYTDDNTLVTQLIPDIRTKLPWLQTGIHKKRRSRKQSEQAGELVFGEKPDTEIMENGVKYALDLTLNQDASFYIDTQNLRYWLKDNMAGKSLLNTFAYTGSLGIAALAGGATDVVQLDLNKYFLAVAKKSALLNGFPVTQPMHQTADFWARIQHFKTIEKTFDCVILDPPIYSKTEKGTIDTLKNYPKLINKVRPLINHNGTLITINNALFLSGQDHYQSLEKLCQDGYLEIEKIIPVPESCIGDNQAPPETLPTQPKPYNYSTKITILRVKKKL